jgi:hypothetical protein
MFYNAMFVPEIFYISSSARNYKIFLLYMKKQDTSGTNQVEQNIVDLKNLIELLYLQNRISLQNVVKNSQQIIAFFAVSLMLIWD